VTVAIDSDIQSKDDLAGKVVGVQLGTTGEEAAKKIEGAQVKNYDEVSQAFLDLMNGQIDAVIADNPLALGYVGQNPDKIKIVGEPFTDEFYGIAVCKTNTDLLDKLNKALAQVKAEGVIEQLSQKWLAGGQ
jgi:polar amino acid transport system substrate-binding protein